MAPFYYTCSLLSHLDLHGLASPLYCLPHALNGRPGSFFFFFNDPAPPEIYPLPLPDALPISDKLAVDERGARVPFVTPRHGVEAAELVDLAICADAQDVCIVGPDVDDVADDAHILRVSANEIGRAHV